MHCLALQLPNNGPWVNNGKTLANIVNFIHRSPEIIAGRVDANKIILVGHSFGGASVAVALAERASAAGGVLLDPAAISRDLPAFLGQVNKPVILLGADEHVSSARNRDYFYRFIRSDIAEVSIKHATHEDAQFPSRYAHSTEELQITFVSALTAAAFSLSSTGKLDYAWSSFRDGLENGKFFNARRK
jgi:pimeloyl-ACP methyl ester carboxylesterase